MPGTLPVSQVTFFFSQMSPKLTQSKFLFRAIICLIFFFLTYSGKSCWQEWLITAKLCSRGDHQGETGCDSWELTERKASVGRRGRWKQLVSIDEWINKGQYNHTVGYYSVLKMNKILTRDYMNEPWGLYTKWNNKPVTKWQILNDSAYVRCLEQSNS